MRPMLTNPSTVARETLRELAARKLPPTPDNYAHLYHEIAQPGLALAGPTTTLREVADELAKGHGDGLPDAVALKRAVEASDWPHVKVVLKRMCAAPAPATATALPTWAPLIRELFVHWEARTPGLTQARKREALEHVLTAFAGSPDGLYARLRGLVRSWADAPAIPAAAVALAEEDGYILPKPVVPGDAFAVWREMVAQTLTFGIVERLGYSPDVALEAQKLAAEVLLVADAGGAAAFATKLKRFWITLELHCDDQRDIQKGLLRLLHLLTSNLAELAGDTAWMRGQLQAVASLAQGPVNMEMISALERRLREVSLQQGVLKQSLDQAKDAMKDMMATFIDRVGRLAEDTGGYHDKLARYAVEIKQADNITQLSSLIVEVMDNTRAIQSDLGRSRDELLAARKSVEEIQARAVRLEGELSTLSDRLHEDHLTQVLNRRGLERAFEIEASRADRYERPLSLAMLDIDNFKALNDRLGHQAGDLALVHLVRIVRQSIRPSDVMSRFGGEEFVILLPETVQSEAVKVMTRVQRALTRRFFLHNRERVLITFSAGVAQRVVGEGEADLIARADRALYHAKQTGKNRVIAA